ncbi:MAG: hypothetical protein AAF959_23370, partial [Cyanobacteria bacterium P01_D01_bin.56]
MPRLLGSVGFAIVLLLAVTPRALAKPGWGEWQKITGSNEALPYTAGFSNLELGGYLEYEAQCNQAATVAQEPFTYWYRLSNLVLDIGTGRVENRCQEGDDVVATYSSTAVLLEIDEPYCLIVNTDVGNGLRVRQDATITAQQIGFLPNGTEVFPGSLPALIVTDKTG